MAKSKLLGPKAIYGLFKELRAADADERPLVVGGSPALVPVLRRELVRDGDPGAVREGRAGDGAAVLVYVLGGAVVEEDERALRDAARARVPIVAVVSQAAANGPVPFVLATDVVEVPAGEGFAIEGIARAVALRLGEEATPLAARLPVLRRAVCAELIRRFSFRSALVGAAVFVPGADLPILSLNQMRLVGRIASAHGMELEPERALELAAVLGGGFGFRAIARELLDLVPVAGWAVKAAVAWTGARAFGEAAVRYYAARAR